MPRFPELPGVEHPIVQAPMAGTSTPALAAAACEAGALGSIAVGAANAVAAREMIRQTRGLTSRPFNVNVFCHRPARPDSHREAAWIARLAPHFQRCGAPPPARLTEIYRSFVEDDAMLAAFVEERPAVVSFHFGLPPDSYVAALKGAGIRLLATVTNLSEGRRCAAAGLDGVVAQGFEAGGHRGTFDPDAWDPQLGTVSLVRELAANIDLPIIAAGGIMTGGDIAAALDVGAAAAQLGTAFVACPESAADQGFRAAFLGPGAARTVMTRAISGRPARCIANLFTTLGENVAPADVPDYPIAYDAGKALNAAAKAKGEYGYGAQWAGTGAPKARAMPAGELVRTLVAELKAFRGN